VVFALLFFQVLERIDGSSYNRDGCINTIYGILKIFSSFAVEQVIMTRSEQQKHLRSAISQINVSEWTFVGLNHLLDARWDSGKEEINRGKCQSQFGENVYKLYI
jgi:hypothetical protein